MSAQTTEQVAVQGRCLCGAVRFRALAGTAMDACHCGMCRRWGGGPLLAVNCGSSVDFEGSEAIAVFSSSDWAERAFCRSCGTHLFYRFIPDNRYIVPVGLLTPQHPFVFTEQIFIDHKPAYYCFANSTLELTEAEVLAQYAGPEV